MKKTLLPFLFLMIGVIGLNACKDNNKPEEVTKIALDKTSQSLTVGESFALKAKLTPANAVDIAISWSSDKEEVATVSDKGEVKAIGAGEATITAKLKNGNKATCKVTVTAKEEPTPEATVKFKEEKYTIEVSETLDLTDEIEIMNGSDDDLKYVWKSSNNAVTISKDGIAAGKEAGEATIEVNLPNGNSASCTIVVIAEEDDDNNDDNGGESGNKIVTIKPWRVTIEEGATFQLEVNYNGIDKDDVVLKSSDEKVVTVTQEGLITGIKAGSAQIMIEVNGKQQHNSCPVTVNAKIEKGRFTYVIRHVKRNTGSNNDIISDEVVGDDKTIKDIYYPTGSATRNACFVYLDITDKETGEVIKDFATKWDVIELDGKGSPSATSGYTGDVTWWGETEFGLRIKSDKYGIDETINVVISEKQN